MDDADRAQKEIDLELNLALKNRAREVPETGSCHWCKEPIQKGHFCDAYCRNDFEKSKIMKGQP